MHMYIFFQYNRTSVTYKNDKYKKRQIIEPIDQLTQVYIIARIKLLATNKYDETSI